MLTSGGSSFAKATLNASRAAMITLPTGWRPMPWYPGYRAAAFSPTSWSVASATGCCRVAKSSESPLTRRHTGVASLQCGQTQ